ncbi:gamma-interferon-inducible lysosomal thiol reductase [Aplysia californica]|uniref:Gamma-interferon-inducible lysosomal thiol reductase n=1 Tax=Aplysia californica TaxID=6500 RepID=A0ABM0JKR7_APLCA|nr:gamma-interferon-inducible lysosomal thiol reductase [Aplysia californica]
MKYTILLALVAMATAADAASLCKNEDTAVADLTEAAILETAPPVNVTLYYECQCGGCQQFITDVLSKAVDVLGEKGTYMDFNFVPYGNAQESYDKSKKRWVFTCQHGPGECWGNLVETCAIHYKPKFEDHYKFIHCFEENFSYPSSDWKPVLEKCGKLHNMPVEEIGSCVTSDIGNQLEHQMAERTVAHHVQWVPWVIINGVFYKDAADDLLTAVCKAYTGPKPKGCPQ